MTLKNLVKIRLADKTAICHFCHGAVVVGINRVDMAETVNQDTAGIKPYYYKDFTKDKIRVVALDTQNIPYAYAGETQATYTFGFSQEQLEWLVGEALDFTDKTDKAERGVVFLMHTVAANESSNIHNFTLFNKIFQAFKAGTSGTLSRVSY